MTHSKDDDVIARIESLTIERLDLYVAHGWVTPQSSDNDRHFSEIDVARLQLIEQLRGDMAINDEAVPVVLSLIDQVHGLRHQLRYMGQAIELQHETIRGAILATLQNLLSAAPGDPDRNTPSD